jgi:hypothetical protein
MEMNATPVFSMDDGLCSSLRRSCGLKHSCLLLNFGNNLTRQETRKFSPLVFDSNNKDHNPEF